MTDMTRKEREQVEKHFDELHAKATGITPNIPDDISQAMKAAYMAGADYAIDMFACKWISVDDALPVNTEFYYVVLNGSVYTLWYCPSTIEWVEFYTDKEGCLQSRIMKDVTHWMPFPQPPKKGGEK